MVDVPLVIGIIGMLLVLLGFIMIQTHRWTSDDLAFDLVNLFGSGGLVVYAYVGEAWPFLILNGIFAAYSLKEVLFDLIKKKTPKKKPAKSKKRR